MMQHDVLAVVFFPSPCRKSLPDSSGPWREAFCIPQCREIIVPGDRQGLPPGPDFNGMEECKMSYSRVRKTFPAYGNAKSLLPGTRRIFCHGECEEDLWVAGKISWYQQLYCQSLTMEFSDGKLKQKSFFHSAS
jgi:hypothetical protein